MKLLIGVRLLVGAACVVGIAFLLPAPAWADGGTCGAIQPSCPCGVGNYQSCQTLWGGCGSNPSGYMWTYWDCIEDPPGNVHPANVTYHPVGGCGLHCP